MASSRTVLQTSVSELAVGSPSHSFHNALIKNSTEFAQGKVDPVEAGKQGGHTSGSGDAASSESGSGNSGGSAKGQFAHGKVDPVEAGKKGGQTSS